MLDEDTGGIGMSIHGVHILEEEKTKSPALNCSFYTFGRYSDGFCTFFGACRVGSIDYMYRGVCGELSLWGEKEIKDLRVRETLDQYNFTHILILAILHCVGERGFPEPWPVYR